MNRINPIKTIQNIRTTFVTLSSMKCFFLYLIIVISILFNRVISDLFILRTCIGGCCTVAAACVAAEGYSFGSITSKCSFFYIKNVIFQWKLTDFQVEAVQALAVCKNSYDTCTGACMQAFSWKDNVHFSNMLRSIL